MPIRRQFLALLAATAVLAVLATACGDDDSDSDGGNGRPAATATSSKSGDTKDGGYNPCDLLTKEEVEAVLGEAFEAPEKSITGNPLGQTLCMYGAAAETSFGFIQVSVIREKDIMDQLRKSGQTAKKLYTGGKVLFDAGKVTDVPGVGDAAYREGSSLTVLSGTTLFTVSANIKGTKPADLGTDILKALAEKALARMPK